MPPQRTSTSAKFRRARAFVACNLCRLKKYKCDGEMPCMRCKRRQIDCIYASQESADGNIIEYSISSVQELKKRLHSAEALIQRCAHCSQKSDITTQSTYLGTPTESSRHSDVTPRGQTEENDLVPQSFDDLSSFERNQLSLSKQTYTMDEATTDMKGDELVDINSATQNFEFHGSTSVVSFLNSLRKARQASVGPLGQNAQLNSVELRKHSLVTDFHNDNFRSRFKNISGLENLANEENYSLHAMLFIDAYFKSLHFVHPILDQAWFLKRCDDLWNGRTQNLRQSFMALYYGILCLGTCIRTWTEQSINGMNRIQWTCLLFERAERALGRNGSVNDLEAVQAPYILSMVCLHHMDLNLAYAFLGTAIRTAFSTGINRKLKFADPNYPQDSPSLSVSRTWWALHNLEIELSFTLGRPDTLGLETYHNRPLPPVDQSENAIIPVTHQLSLVVRRISAEIYLGQGGPREKLQRSLEIEKELDQRLENLPTFLRLSHEPYNSGDTFWGPEIIRGPYWPQLQKLILKIRYYHTLIVLFYLFFINENKICSENLVPHEQVRAASEKCKKAACSMVKLMHWTYRIHHSFRTWGYNTTYVTFALSIFLSMLVQEPIHERQNSETLEYIRQSLEILESMEDCIVAFKIGRFAKELLSSLLNECDIKTGEQSRGQIHPESVSAPFFNEFAAFFQVISAESPAEFGAYNFFEEGLQDFMV